MAQRFSMNVKANLKAGFQKEALIDDGSAAVGAVLYAIVPTIFGLSGWMGWFVGVAVPYVLGKLFYLPGLCASAIGIGVTHLIYVKGNDTIQKTLNKPIWRFSDAPVTPGQASAGDAFGGLRGYIEPMNGLANNAETLRLNSGQEVLAYNPDTMAAHTISDSSLAGLYPVEQVNQFIASNAANSAITAAVNHSPAEAAIERDILSQFNFKSIGGGARKNRAFGRN